MSLTKQLFEQTRDEMNLETPKAKTRQPKNELLKSLAMFQRECPTIHKGTKGYGYNYADLPTIIETIKPLLEKFNLGFTQLIEDDGLRTIVFHTETGESMETFSNIPLNVDLKGQNIYQTMGSAYSYFKRYQLTAILGVVTSDEDNDASGQPTRSKTQPIKQPEKAKKTLNTTQFNALIGAIQTGKLTNDNEQITSDYAIDKFDLNDEQLLTLKNLKK